MIYIFWSCRNKTEAKQIIHALLNKKLIACASILPEVESIYRWEGVIEEGSEVKVILKTLARHFEAVQHVIQTQCSYEVPEIVQVAVAQGNARYLAWVAHETAPSGSP